MSIIETDRDGRIREIMAEILEIDPSSINPSTGKDNVPTWDSLNHLQLVMALEHEFGIALSMEEVATLNSFEAVRSIVLSRA